MRHNCLYSIAYLFFEGWGKWYAMQLAGSQFPDQGWNPASSAVKVWTNHWTSGELPFLKHGYIRIQPYLRSVTRILFFLAMCTFPCMLLSVLFPYYFSVSIVDVVFYKNDYINHTSKNVIFYTVVQTYKFCLSSWLSYQTLILGTQLGIHSVKV